MIAERFAAWPEIGRWITALFADKTMAELVAEGQAHGVPIAAVLTPAQALAAEHFRAVGALAPLHLADGVTVPAPVGYYVVDGQRAGLRHPAPAPGSAEPDWAPRTVAVPVPGARRDGYPFTGLRILDLGIIVAGGEAGRLFGDLGAEIIKVESAAYPDGLRQARVGDAMSESFAWTHRNNLGLGLDLRSAAGKRIFGALVRQADAVLANFKPGTLDALGFSAEQLHALNPRIVLAQSSAFGDSGPWRTRMGYGPLVRATTGATRLWTAPDAAAGQRHPFYDATTVFPDHVVGRLTAIGALAALIRRDREGDGAGVHISQAEAVINQLDTRYVAEAAAQLTAIRPDTALHAVSPCDGDDEWCVVSIRTDADWRALTTVLGRPPLADDPRFADGAARSAHRTELIAAISAWTRGRSPQQAAAVLQAAGVPAGPMNRAPDIPEDPQLAHRGVYRDMTHPLIDHVLPAETGPAPFRHIPPAAQRPAPVPGQDTREIAKNLLGLAPADVEALIADGVLFADDAPDPQGRR